MLVYVGAEGLFELAFEDAVVSLRLEKLNYGELDAWKGKEFFHTHIPSCLIFFRLVNSCITTLRERKLDCSCGDCSIKVALSKKFCF